VEQELLLIQVRLAKGITGDGTKKRLKWLLLCLLGAAFLAAGAQGLYEDVPHSVGATFLALAGVIAVLVSLHRMMTI